jgi:hypothetical protein
VWAGSTDRLVRFGRSRLGPGPRTISAPPGGCGQAGSGLVERSGLIFGDVYWAQARHVGLSVQGSGVDVDGGVLHGRHERQVFDNRDVVEDEVVGLDLKVLH